MDAGLRRHDGGTVGLGAAVLVVVRFGSGLLRDARNDGLPRRLGADEDVARTIGGLRATR